MQRFFCASGLHNNTSFEAAGFIPAARQGINPPWYASLNQLFREDNEAGGYTCVYTYESGNITSKTTYAYTRSETMGTALKTEIWTYGNDSWGDLLTAYNDGTSTYTVASDASGNITSISDGTDSVAHTWLGRTLQSATIVEDGVTTTANYTYNAEGQRIKKVVGDSVTNYYYNGDILAGLTIDGVTMTFRYDENGVPFSFIYGETEYFYVRNLQGDVAYIVNDFGNIKGYYTYDAWGNVTEIYGDIAEVNPIRYRGYVYDTETGYYYLNSRYYDPELCRFISADDTDYLGANQTVGSYNLFSYCENNPVNLYDPAGTAALMVGKIVAGALINLGASIIAANATGQEFTFLDGVVALIAGAVSTLKSGTLIGALISGVYSGVKSYQSGASIGWAVGCGLVSAFATLWSVGNLAGATGDGIKNVAVATYDFVLGTGMNIAAEAVSVGAAATSQNNVAPKTQQSALTVAINANKISSIRIVNGEPVEVSSRMSYKRWDDNRIYVKVHV